MMDGYVWYACYGSNLSRSRFMRYIRGCADVTPPVCERAFEIPYRLVFAGASSWWDGGGVAFLDADTAGETRAKLYKITAAQFAEVQRKEGTLYTRRLSLGMVEGLPVYSFTCEQLPPRSLPGIRYVDTILSGLTALYPDDDPRRLMRYIADAVVSDKEARLLRVLRSAPHGVSMATLGGIMPREQAAALVTTLGDAGAVRQDGRTVRAGILPTDDDAVWYTVRERREIIDWLLDAKDEGSV